MGTKGTPDNATLVEFTQGLLDQHPGSTGTKLRGLLRRVKPDLTDADVLGLPLAHPDQFQCTSGTEPQWFNTRTQLVDVRRAAAAARAAQRPDSRGHNTRTVITSTSGTRYHTVTWCKHLWRHQPPTPEKTGAPPCSCRTWAPVGNDACVP